MRIVLSFPVTLAFAACTSPRDVPVAAPANSVVVTAPASASFTPPNPPPVALSAPPVSDIPPEDDAHDTKLRLGNGADLIVELNADSSDNLPELALVLRQGETIVSRREGWVDLTHFDLKNLHPCETWSTHLELVSLGLFDAVRIRLICHVGEDYSTNSEIALLVKPDTLETIWAGLADRFENAMDSCIQSRHVTFRLVTPKTIEKKIVEETRWIDQTLDESVKSRLKRDCKIRVIRSIEQSSLP